MLDDFLLKTMFHPRDRDPNHCSKTMFHPRARQGPKSLLQIRIDSVCRDLFKKQSGCNATQVVIAANGGDVILIS